MIEGLPLLADSSDGMASVAAYTYRRHSVVFIGTRTGSLKKVGRGPGEGGLPGLGPRNLATLHRRLLSHPPSPTPVPTVASVAGFP